MKMPLTVLKDDDGDAYGIADANGDRVLDLGCIQAGCHCAGEAEDGLLELLVGIANGITKFPLEGAPE